MATIFGGNEGLSGALAPHTARMRQISLYDFGLDQLDLLADHACVGRIWLLPPRYLRAMVLPQSGDSSGVRGAAWLWPIKT